MSHAHCAHIPPGAGLVKADALPLSLLCCLYKSPHRGHIGEPATSPESPSEKQGAEGAEGSLKASLVYPNSSPLLGKM